MGIFSTLAKNWKLMRIMRRIGMPHSIADLAEQVISQEPSDAKKAEHELFDLVYTDRETRAILEHYGATRADIEACYRRLSAMGLGRWIRESYVAAAAIAVKPTLIYLLEATVFQFSKCAQQPAWCVNVHVEAPSNNGLVVGEASPFDGKHTLSARNAWRNPYSTRTRWNFTWIPRCLDA